MPTVTALEEIPERRKRRHVVFRGAETVELSLEIALSAGMLPGRTVSAEDIRRAVAEDRLASATEAALRLLRTRDRSEAELRRELKRRGCDTDSIAAVVKKCREWGYLDDERLAQGIVSEALDHKHLGPARIKQTLRQRGIDETTASRARGKAEDDAPPLVEQALAALKPKMRSYERLEPEAAKRRMIGFLQRRGFDYETIRDALKRFKNEGIGED